MTNLEKMNDKLVSPSSIIIFFNTHLKKNLTNSRLNRILYRVY